MRWFPALLVLGCLPQVGPPVLDGSMTDAGDGGGAAGGASGGIGGAGGTGGAGGGQATGGGGDGGGGSSPCAGFAACPTFVTSATNEVTFPNGNDVYSPKCLRVSVGQTVRLRGDFSEHPLRHACGPTNVLMAHSTGNLLQVTFSIPGVYGYYCTTHGTASGADMAGAIEVVP